MFHNFTFVENDNTHFIRWNPTSIEFGRKERTVFSSLDGPPIVHYQDTTEVLGSFIWENVPVKKRFQYQQLENLVGKSGVIYTNEMPQLVGEKNLLPNSHLGDLLGTPNFWEVGGSGTYEAGTSVYGPDGVSLATLYTTTAASVAAGNIQPSTESFTFKEHNVLSCYIKYGGSSRIGLNLFKNTGTTHSHTALFNLSSSVVQRWTNGATEFGYYKLPHTDGWYRLWVYLHAPSSDIGYDIQGTSFQPIFYPNVLWASPQEIGTYITDIQLEHGVTEPTWFARTDGSAINEPLNMEFLDLQTEYQDNPGVVKHTLTLNFKLFGEWI